MLSVLFAVLPNANPWAERTARGLWLAAAVIWAWHTVGSR